MWSISDTTREVIFGRTWAEDSDELNMPGRKETKQCLTMISMAVHRDVPQYIAIPWLITSMSFCLYVSRLHSPSRAPQSSAGVCARIGAEQIKTAAYPRFTKQ
ncbi:hypothetical protein EYF80_017192 [Liparis tanakae]|uniref:Uncharacterized protein n=1 Tax=Liparis tanakae TaxID=230148 RepID=A0A4Z2I560_9TELE|nr:hypothetical protein EYF80_017192 [Liparis tanakae]